MAKKKRKKSSKGVFAILGEGIRFSLFVTLKTLPFVILLAAGAGLFAGVHKALFADPGLQIQKVAVQPADALPAPSLTRLESQLIGKNILTAPIQRVSSELEKSPAILRATVVKQFPSTLAVNIEKRIPAAYVLFSENGSAAIVSEDGMILEVVSAKNITGLVIEAYGLGPAELSMGQRIRDRGFFEAMKFLKVYQKHPLSRYEPLTKIMVDKLANTKILLGPGPEIRLGRHPVERLSALEKAMALLVGGNRKNIDYIDLEFGNVVVKPKRGTV